MAKDSSPKFVFKNKEIIQKSGGHGIWFLGFIGALVYYIYQKQWLTTLEFTEITTTSASVNLSLGSSWTTLAFTLAN